MKVNRHALPALYRWRSGEEIGAGDQEFTHQTKLSSRISTRSHPGGCLDIVVEVTALRNKTPKGTSSPPVSHRTLSYIMVPESSTRIQTVSRFGDFLRPEVFIQWSNQPQSRRTTERIAPGSEDSRIDITFIYSVCIAMCWSASCDSVF